MYQVGDIVEFIYQKSLGRGEMIKIEKRFFLVKYYIKTTVITEWFVNYETVSERVLIVKEKDIIRKLGQIPKQKR